MLIFKIGSSEEQLRAFGVDSVVMVASGGGVIIDITDLTEVVAATCERRSVSGLPS